MEGINFNQIGVSFKGSGSYVPPQILTNQKISNKVDTSDEWIESRTGISERRIASLEEDVTKMGYEQAAHTLANGDIIGIAGKHNGEVHIISSSGDNITPTTTAKKIAKSFEGSSLEILPGLGHASYVEDADIFSKSVLKFLENN